MTCPSRCTEFARTRRVVVDKCKNMLSEFLLDVTQSWGVGRVADAVHEHGVHRPRSRGLVVGTGVRLAARARLDVVEVGGEVSVMSAKPVLHLLFLFLL